MQDITEQRELAQEISDAISKPVGFGEEFDDVGAALLFLSCFSFYFDSVTLNYLLSQFSLVSLNSTFGPRTVLTF